MWRYFVPVVVLGVLAAFFYGGLGMNPSRITSPLVGKPAPEFTLPTVRDPGARIGSADLAGQVSLLNVWGSWCGPCRAESDDLQRVQDQTRDQGVQFLGIDVRDQRGAAQDFHDNHDISYPSLFDPSGRSLLALDNFPRSTVPATIVLDRQHRVAGIFLTQVRDEELLPHVERVAQEQPQA